MTLEELLFDYDVSNIAVSPEGEEQLIFVTFTDGSKGYLEPAREGGWQFVEEHYTDHATATGMYDR